MMPTTAPEFFLHYTQRVLGLRNLPQRIRPVKQLLVMDIPWPEGLGRDEMFQKMMAAVSIAGSQYDIFEGLPAELPGVVEELSRYSLIFCFSRELAEALEQLKASYSSLSFELFVAAGPRDLRKDPNQKRQTWEQLKALKSRLPN